MNNSIGQGNPYQLLKFKTGELTFKLIAFLRPWIKDDWQRQTTDFILGIDH